MGKKALFILSYIHGAGYSYRLAARRRDGRQEEKFRQEGMGGSGQEWALV